MLFAIATLLTNILGLDFDKALRVARWVFVGIVVVVVLIPTIFIYRACNRPAKLDIKNIEKINKANETERLKELEKVIVENADVVKTVDQRNTIAETGETEKQAAIWAKIREADAKIVEVKSQGRDITSEELGCLLIPANCK